MHRVNPRAKCVFSVFNPRVRGNACCVSQRVKEGALSRACLKLQVCSLTYMHAQCCGCKTAGTDAGDGPLAGAALEGCMNSQVRRAADHHQAGCNRSSVAPAMATGSGVSPGTSTGAGTSTEATVAPPSRPADSRPQHDQQQQHQHPLPAIVLSPVHRWPTHAAARGQVMALLVPVVPRELLPKDFNSVAVNFTDEQLKKHYQVAPGDRYMPRLMCDGMEVFEAAVHTSEVSAGPASAGFRPRMADSTFGRNHEILCRFTGFLVKVLRLDSRAIGLHCWALPHLVFRYCAFLAKRRQNNPYDEAYRALQLAKRVCTYMASEWCCLQPQLARYIKRDVVGLYCQVATAANKHRTE